MPMYNFNSLQNISLEQLADCFNLAFSDYEQPIHFTTDSLKYYLTASRVDLSLSFGAFCREQLVGFILNSSGIYHGQAVVFDAGTGVIPEHRGKQVFSGLFAYTAEQLRDQKIKRYYLEVLQENHHAVSIYRKKGFSILREYSVLVASGFEGAKNPQVAALPYGDFQTFETTFSVEPSFEHTMDAIQQNPQLYEVLYLPGQAYCIHAKRNGELIQLHYHNLEALKDVLSVLAGKYPSAMAKNIDYKYPDVINVLQEIGFKEITKQYEMVRDL